MSKRIVVGLDPSEYTEAALRVAIERAKRAGGTVIGVGTVDVPGIERSSSGAGVGASHFAKKAREKHITEAEEVVEGLIESFKTTCETAGVSYETEYKSGEPAREIGDAGRSADLILLGTRSHFNFETDKKHGDTIQEVLHERACPVMAVPKGFKLPFKHVVCPYDGSMKASRALREFVALSGIEPVATDVVLLRIDDDVDDGLRDLERPAQYLEAYGFKVDKKVLPGDAPEVILSVAKEHQPGLVVLGTSGKSGLRAFLFGSVTRTLLEDGTIPMFVAG